MRARYVHRLPLAFRLESLIPNRRKRRRRSQSLSTRALLSNNNLNKSIPRHKHRSLPPTSCPCRIQGPIPLWRPPILGATLSWHRERPAQRSTSPAFQDCRAEVEATPQREAGQTASRRVARPARSPTLPSRPSTISAKLTTHPLPRRMAMPTAGHRSRRRRRPISLLSSAQRTLRHYLSTGSRPRRMGRHEIASSTSILISSARRRRKNSQGWSSGSQC